jgi:class 3 adenylate cyclase
MTPTLVVGVALALLGVLAGALYRQWRWNRGLQAQLEAAAEELQHLQEACSRLAPVGVVQRLVADGVKPGTEPAAERKVVTALFADLVGSTAMSERLEPADLARVLNGYFQRMSDAIHEHRGHVSTFLGDGILAYFGALQPNPWQCDDAVRAALAMRAAMSAYNLELARDGLPPLAVGIGIHRGPGLVGLVGSRERREYAYVRTRREHRGARAGPHARSSGRHPRYRGAARRAGQRLRARAHARGVGEGGRRAPGHLRGARALARSRAGDELTGDAGSIVCW